MVLSETHCECKSYSGKQALVWSLRSLSCHAGVEILQPSLCVSAPAEEWILGAGTPWSRMWFTEGETQILHTSVAQLENSWILACHVQDMQVVFPRSAGNNSSISLQGSIKCSKWGQGTYRIEILRCLWFFYTVFLVSFLPRQHLKSSEAKSSHIFMMCTAFTSWHNCVSVHFFIVSLYKLEFKSLVWLLWCHVKRTLMAEVLVLLVLCH